MFSSSEGQSPKSRCQQGQAPSEDPREASSLASSSIPCLWPCHSHLGIHLHLAFVSMSSSLLSLLRTLIGFRPHPDKPEDSHFISLSHICRLFLQIRSHSQSCGSEHRHSFWGATVLAIIPRWKGKEAAEGSRNHFLMSPIRYCGLSI